MITTKVRQTYINPNGSHALVVYIDAADHHVGRVYSVRPEALPGVYGLELEAINPHQSQNEKGEQRGFANLLRGTFGMFRNPTAHEARIHWAVTKEDAEDLLSLLSLIHQRLDNTENPASAAA